MCDCYARFWGSEGLQNANSLSKKEGTRVLEIQEHCSNCQGMPVMRARHICDTMILEAKASVKIGRISKMAPSEVLP